MPSTKKMPFLAPHSIYISCCTNFQYNFVTCSRTLCVYVHEIFLNEINNIFDFSASFHCHLILCPAQMFSTDGCGETSINQYLERGEKKGALQRNDCFVRLQSRENLYYQVTTYLSAKVTAAAGKPLIRWKLTRLYISSFDHHWKWSSSFFRCYISAASPLVFPNREMAMLYFGGCLGIFCSFVSRLFVLCCCLVIFISAARYSEANDTCVLTDS